MCSYLQNWDPLLLGNHVTVSESVHCQSLNGMQTEISFFFFTYLPHVIAVKVYDKKGGTLVL